MARDCDHNCGSDCDPGYGSGYGLDCGRGYHGGNRPPAGEYAYCALSAFFLQEDRGPRQIASEENRQQAEARGAEVTKAKAEAERSSGQGAGVSAYHVAP